MTADLNQVDLYKSNQLISVVTPGAEPMSLRNVSFVCCDFVLLLLNAESLPSPTVCIITDGVQVGPEVIFIY